MGTIPVRPADLPPQAALSRRRCLTVLAGITVMPLLAACGGAGSTSAQATTTTAPVSQPAATSSQPTATSASSSSATASASSTASEATTAPTAATSQAATSPAGRAVTLNAYLGVGSDQV